MDQGRLPARKPCKVIYCYPDNTQEEFLLVSHGNSTSSRNTRPHDASFNANEVTPRSRSRRHTDSPQLGRSTSPNRRRRGEDSSKRRRQHPADTDDSVGSFMEYGGCAELALAAGDTSSNNEMIVSNSEPIKADESEGDSSPYRECHGAVAMMMEKPRRCCCEYCRPERCADITPMGNPRIGAPGPVTLFAFGMTTCLYNVHVAGICPLNLQTLGLIVFYGGLTQFIGGFLELMNKNTIFCTLCVSYGAFWMATALATLVPPNDNVTETVPSGYMGGFFLLWACFAGTMFFSSFHMSYVQITLMLAVTVNFIIQTIANFIESERLMEIAGYEGIGVGALAVYVGMALTMRDTYGRNILPLLMQKNGRITGW